MTKVSKQKINEILNRRLDCLTPAERDHYKNNNIFGSDYFEDIFEQKDRFVDTLFSECFRRKKLLEDGKYTTSYEEGLLEWEHIKIEDLDQKRRCLGIDRKALKNLADIYKNNDFLWCKELDWVLVNSLLFAELLAYFDYYYTNNTSIFRQYIEHNSSKNFKFRYFLWNFVSFVIKCTFIISSFYINKYFGYLLSFIYVLSVVKNIIKNNKFSKCLQRMWIVYSCSKEVNFNWNKLLDEMNNSRKGYMVMWDDELYNLVDMRLFR